MGRLTLSIFPLICLGTSCADADPEFRTAAIQEPAPPSERIYTRPDPAELEARLTRQQYRVTQEGGTEPPFQNAYWDLTQAGIYVDIVSGEPLFSSRDKYDAGTGWPSFKRALVLANVTLVRAGGPIEIRSKHADSHLGHLFPDGPRPSGIRYSVNSAALRFIPLDELDREGYGRYLDFAARD